MQTERQTPGLDNEAHTAVLALGANLGDPAAQLAAAVQSLADREGIALVRRSAMIVTAPWGDTNQDDFHNMAVVVETTLSPQELLAACLEIERALGRVRVRKWGPRMIDIDVIAYDRQELESETLTLPHPYAHERDFVLRPVREIAPEVADWLLARKQAPFS